WDVALDELSAAVKAARDGGKKVVYVGPYRSGTIVDVLQAFTGGNTLFWEPLGRDAEALAAKALFGPGASLPRYNLAKAHYVLSFGAAFLGDAWGNAGNRSAFADARDANTGHYVARFVAITPHQDQTAANADDWHACKPGTEAMVALAIARLVADKKGYQGPARAMLAAGDPKAAADASGIPESTIVAISAMFAAGGAVALPGGIAGASAAATRLAAATFVLNAIADERDLFSGGGYRGPVSSYGDVEQLIADLDAGTVGVLIVDDVDPVHALPGSRFAEAMGKAALTVSTSSFPSETVAAAKLVLPTNDVFEDWGDEEPWAGYHLIRQPAMLPLYSTMPLADLLFTVWRKVDPATAPAIAWRDVVKARWAALGYAQTVDPTGAAPLPVGPLPLATAAPAVFAEAPFMRWWEGVLTSGFVETPADRRLEVVGSVDLAGSGEPAGTGEYYLQVFAHPFILDGRYANEPWAHEVPDPMTGQVWDSWVLVHPETASKLGVSDNDLVKVAVGDKSIEVGIEVHPCIRPDTIAIPLGGGRTRSSGRYAENVGKNVASILAPTKDPSGALVWQQSKCSVVRAGSKAELVSLFGNDDDQGRNFVAVVDAGEWEKTGDVEAEDPGHLTGIHELPMDRRLVAAEAEWHKANPDAEPEKTQFVDFYPVPDHPTYRFAMTIDTNACNGCGACSVACYAENNLAVVGKWKLEKHRQMSWIRINRYFAAHAESATGEGEGRSVHFVPMLCQHCGHAPCESVCPVLATYHSIDGLNAMVYNRCVGTRYCANACPYSVRRFNYHSYVWPEPFNLQLNPDVTARTMGVMEKCTFCVQRIRRTKSAYRDLGFTNTVPDDALRQLPACAEACPSQAITFGNLVDPESVPAKTRKSGRSYLALADVNTFPAINYLARASFHVQRHHAGGESEHVGSNETHPAPAHAGGQ
ncbi:MAG: 4Fe-4S dicluster domain-containing protein, partial [Myxococcota bacterium]